MATNTLRPQQTAVAATNKGEFKYLANNEEIKLSANIVRQYLVSGDPQNVTPQEIMMFMSLCKYQHLNPFLREAYLVKYGNAPATIVTGKDTFTKRAERDPRYKGKQAGIIVQNPTTAEIEYREGTFVIPGEQILGGWAKIFIEGKEPEYNTVSFEEYAGRKKDGTLNNQWATKPATMIRKVAVVQALREAFPNEFGAMYSPEEMNNMGGKDGAEIAEAIAKAVDDDNPVIIPDDEKREEVIAEPVPESAEAALFG